MFIILTIVLVLSSVIFWPYPVNDSFWVIKETVFVLGALSLLSYSFYQQSRRNFSNLLLGIGLLYVALGFIYFFYSSFITATGKVNWNFWNFKPTINVICGLLLIKILYEYCEGFRDWINVGKVIAWIGGLFAVYSIFQYFGIDQIFNREGARFLYTNGAINSSERMVTFFGSNFITSAFLATCAPMCLIFKGLKYKIFYGIILISLVLLDKTMALAAFGSGLIVYLLMNKSWIKLLLLSIASLSFLIFKFVSNPVFFSPTGRIEVWQMAWNKFLEAPFLGHGLGYFEMFQFKSGSLINKAQVSVFFAHNEYLQILVDVGVLGLLIVMLFMFDLFKEIYRSDKNILLIGYTSGLVSFLVLCIGSFPLRIAPIVLVAIIYIAGLLYLSEGESYG